MASPPPAPKIAYALQRGILGLGVLKWLCVCSVPSGSRPTMSVVPPRSSRTATRQFHRFVHDEIPAFNIIMNVDILSTICQRVFILHVRLLFRARNADAELFPPFFAVILGDARADNFAGGVYALAQGRGVALAVVAGVILGDPQAMSATHSSLA